MSNLFSPIKLGPVEFSNRVVISPMCQYSADDGSATDWHMAHLGMLANSGAGLVIVEATHVERHGRITHGCMGLYSDHNEASLKRVIEHCRRAGTAKWGVQIAHAGRKASSQRPWEGGGALKIGEDPWETVAASPLPFGPGWHVPRVATHEDIARVRDAFVNSAKRAVRIGFDAIELHYAHGYLAHSFLSPVSNHRTDQYGGSLENRMRFGREIARAVREAVPKSIALGARITGNDWRDDGISTDDAVAFSKALKADGLDYIDVSSGGIAADTRNPTGPGYNVPLAERIKKEAGIATRVVGLITSPAQAEAIIAEDRADMVALGRGMLDDPRWGWHAGAELGADVVRPPQYLRAGPKLWSPGAACPRVLSFDRMRNLAINAERLWGEIMETAAFGGTQKGGVCRLTLTDLDRQVRDWFKARAEKLGCRVTVDDMGAMFARRDGTADVPPIAMGSHLDTQPTGGKFDGVLGVLAALEALRILVEAGYETYAPIEVVNWTNEEGSRFAPAMVSSGVFAKVFDREKVYATEDRGGITFGAALDAIGYRGPQRCGEHPLSAFFELHIEQGPILEAEDKDIGIVTGVQAVRWYEATLTGQDAHTGATPMHLRKNALLGAARMIEAVDRIGRKYAPGVATVGLIENRPNSRNVVPGAVFFTVDLRHPDDDVLQDMQEEFYDHLHVISGDLALGLECAAIWQQPAVKFDPDCVAAVRQAAQISGCTAREIVSGASHDAAYVSRVAPSAMVFVPCRGGISHNEAEFSTKEQCAKGAQVLLQAVLDYDRKLAEKGTKAGDR